MELDFESKLDLINTLAEAGFHVNIIAVTLNRIEVLKEDIGVALLQAILLLLLSMSFQVSHQDAHSSINQTLFCRVVAEQLPCLKSQCFVVFSFHGVRYQPTMCFLFCRVPCCSPI